MTAGLVYKAKVAISKAQSTLLPEQYVYLQRLMEKFNETVVVSEQDKHVCRSINYLSSIEVWDLVQITINKTNPDMRPEMRPEQKYQTISAFVSLLEAVRPSAGRYLRRITEDNGFIYGSNWKQCVQAMSGNPSNATYSDAKCTTDRILSHSRTLCLQLQQRESITRAAILNHLSRECIVPLMPSEVCTRKKFTQIVKKLCSHPLYKSVMKTYADTYCTYCIGKQTHITLFEDEDTTTVVDLSQNNTLDSTSGELLPLSPAGWNHFVESVYEALVV